MPGNPARRQDHPFRALPGSYRFSRHAWQTRLVRLTDRLSQPQRIAIVIALAAAFGAAGMYIDSLGNGSGGGWYAYAPLSQSGYPPHTGLAGWERLIIWLALIGLWALVSVRVLRPAPDERPHD
jgi:hypothetical protein